MIYENKSELYKEYKDLKETCLNSSSGYIRISSSILCTNAKKGIYEIKRNSNGSEQLFEFKGLALAILFLIKGQFELYAI